MRRMRTTPARIALVSLMAVTLSLRAAAQDAASLHAAGTRNAITGQVVDKAGKPVAGAVVTIVEKGTTALGAARFHPLDVRVHSVTNEQGAYHLDNLPLGECYVVAIPHNAVTVDGRVNRSGFETTYYPSAHRAADAMPVSVNIREASIANITMIPAALSVVSGSVIGQNGQPVHGGSLQIAHGDNLYGIDSMAMRLRPDGSFLLPALPPGHYFLQFHESAWPPPHGEIPLISYQPITVDGSDLAGVRVAPMHMVHVSGKVIVAAEDRASLQPSQVQIGTNPFDADGNPGPARPGVVKDDLTFDFAVWPRRQSIRLLSDDNAWTLGSVHRGGVDITNQPIDFKEGQDVSGIEITLVRRGRH